MAIWLAVLVLPVLTACGGKVRPPPEFHLTLAVAAAADINPDPSGRPSPVALTVLQLKTADTFMNADFFAATNPSNAALAADVVGREEVTVKPGETRDIPIKIESTATYIGVVAAFRDIEHAAWRTQMQLPALPADAHGPQDVAMAIHLDALTVTIDSASR